MKRFLVVLTAVAVCALAVSPALFGTVHPLANSECSADAAAGTAADTQDPPGLTPGGPDSSHADVARPVIAVFVASLNGAESDRAFKTPPTPGPFEFCPAQNP